MFCSPNQWKGAKFPRDKFYDSKSKAGGVLMHSKVRGRRACGRGAIADTGIKMIIAMMRDENQLNEKGKCKEANYDNLDSDVESDDHVVEVRNEVGWAYVGSHNFTPSAWGNLSGSSFNPVLNVRCITGKLAH